MNNLLTYEDKLDYLIDMVENGDANDWDKAVDDLGLKLNSCSLRKAFNTTSFSGYQVAKYYSEKSTDYMADEQIEKLEEIKDNIYKERTKLQDANREKRANLRFDARYENLVEILKDNIVEYNVDKFIDFKKYNVDSSERKEASLILSDIHLGLTVDNILNFYSINTCKEYFETLYEKTVKYCKLNNVDTLHIELLGDLISGNIQVSHKTDHEEDVISQIITVSEIVSEFIMKLKMSIDKVVVYGVVGNHSRAEANKKNVLGRENFERLIFEYIKLRVPSVKFITNGYEDFLCYNVGEKKIAITHGDKDNISNVKKHMIDVLGIIPTELHLAHIHHFKAEDDNGTIIIVNGSFIGTDDYAIGLRCNTRPYQILRIHGEDDISQRLYLN